MLYDFCVARSDLRGAAAAQLAWARRLRSEAPNSAAVLGQTADALGACPLCLWLYESRGDHKHARCSHDSDMEVQVTGWALLPWSTGGRFSGCLALIADDQRACCSKWSWQWQSPYSFPSSWGPPTFASVNTGTVMLWAEHDC